MPFTPYSSSDLTRSRNNRQIYSGYRINIQANQLGIPAIPTAIKGPSRDIIQAFSEGPTNFTPAELTAILNNNSGSTAPSGQPPIIFSSNTSIAPNLPVGYTIPAGYTSMNYVLIGGGGGHGGESGMGGGSGGISSGNTSITEGQPISITLGAGGNPGNSGGSTILNINAQPLITVTGGNSWGPYEGGGNGGIPNGVQANSGLGAALAPPYQAYGRGGNGSSAGGGVTPSAGGYYSITLT